MTDAAQVGSEDIFATRANNLLVETGPEFAGLVALPPDSQHAYLEANPTLEQRTAKSENDLPQVYRALWGVIVSVAEDSAPLYDDLDYPDVARVGALLAADSLVSFYEDNEYDRPGKAFVLTPKIVGHITRHLEMKLLARATVRELAGFLQDEDLPEAPPEIPVEIEPPKTVVEQPHRPEDMINPKRADYLSKIFGEEHRETIINLTRPQAVALADKVGDLYRGIPKGGGMTTQGQFIRASQLVHYVSGRNMVDVARMYNQVHGSASSGLYRTLPKNIGLHYEPEVMEAALAEVVADEHDRTEQIFAKYADDMMPPKWGQVSQEATGIIEQQALPIEEVESSPQPAPPEPEWYKSPLHAEAPSDPTDQDIRDVLERVMPRLRFARDTEKRSLRTLFNPTTETWREPRDLNGVRTDLLRMIDRNAEDFSLPLDCKLSKIETDLLLEIVKSPVDPDKQMTVVRTLRAYTPQGVNGSKGSRNLPPARRVLVSALLKLGDARELQLK